MQKSPLYQRHCIKQVRLPYPALLMIMIKKPSPAFLAVQPSLISIEQSRTILPEKNTEVFGRIGKFFVKCHGFLLHHSVNATRSVLILHQ